MQRTVKSFGIIACFIIISTISPGCILLPEHGLFLGRGKIIESDLAFLVEGKTTREEVLLQFGEPDGVLNDGTILGYRWSVSKGVVIVANSPLVHETYLIFEFNPDSTLRRFIKGHRSMPWSDLTIKKMEELIRKDIKKMDSSNESDTEE